MPSRTDELDGASSLPPKGASARVRALRFNRGIIEHNFCRTCGVQAFGYGKGPDGAPMAAINLRCLADFDRSRLQIQQVNGREF